LYGRSTASFTVSWDNEVRRTSSNQPDWSDMLRASLDGIEPILSRMDALGMDAYDLWDQNAAVWKARAGFEPQVDVVSAADGDAMDMWLPGDRDDAIMDLQELLAARNLYYGPVNGSYNAMTRLAVTRLQTMEGLVATGAADQQVWSALTSLARSPAVETPAVDLPPSKGRDAAFGTPYTLGDLAVLTIDRYWYARSVFPTHQTDPLLGVSVQNTDNALLAVEGAMQNLDTKALDLYWLLPATLLYDDLYAFPCTVQRERDQGTRSDSQLQPLEKARLILCAELPESVINSDKSLVLEISLQNETLQFTLR
ncbi:MAG TPA: peptidoglycan-binding domain-containing protein, partial [Clostridia bacterium]|nr:peptidoglycan-binding domain-containing protein [Clostridia bacterium]